MAADRQSNLTEEGEEMLRFMQATTNNAVGTGLQLVSHQPFTLNPALQTFPVEIREEKWVVLYKCRPDKFNWNHVEGVILKDKESGAEVKLTIKDLCIAAGLTW